MDVSEDDSKGTEDLEQPLPKTFAASSATEAEELIAKRGQHPDGSTPVQVAKRAYRPKVRTVYEEPEELLDTSGDIDWLFEEHGTTLIHSKAELPPRDDLIRYDPVTRGPELDKNIQWRDCPSLLRPILREIIEKFYDVFSPDGMQKPIRGFEFNIDTGAVVPLCCKPPRYGPHEERVIRVLVEKLETKGIVEDDLGPWGSQIVLASKPSQAHVHWSQFVFRLCVSYRKLNAITRPFTFPVTRCDDAVEGIGDAEYFLTMDYDAGYWQVKMNQASKEKTAFFTPDGKKHFNNMPMGATNAHPAFVAMVNKFKEKWNEIYDSQIRHGNEANWTWLKERLERQLEEIRKNKAHKDDEMLRTMEAALQEAKESMQARQGRQKTTSKPGSAVIVDDVILYAKTLWQLLFYFTCVLSVLQHHRVTVKLLKTRLLPKQAEFVGVDVMKEGNALAKSKYDAIDSLERPELFTDLRMLIGRIRYYRHRLPLSAARNVIYRELLKQHRNSANSSNEP